MTIIIPSLGRIPRFYQQTIYELSACDAVTEIILIDNTTNIIPIDIPKVIHICEGKNTYINPAWNKGAKLANTDKLCFLNDDLWFDWSYLSLISEHITKDKGMIGMSNDNYNTTLENFSVDLIQPSYRSNRGNRPLGFACCFFIHKDNWVDIPENIKLWAGDDWQFYANPNHNYTIGGIKCEGHIAGTLDDKELETEFNPIKYNDMLLIREEIRKGRIDNFLVNTKWDKC